MKTQWESPKTIIGNVATGEFYYQRDEIVEEIWSEIEKDNNILIAAPRRVGKTSVMKFMVQNPQKGYIMVFENIQSINSSEGFYKKIYLLILECLSNSEKSLIKVKDYLKSKKITKFSKDGVEIEHSELNYLDELNELIPKLKDNDEMVILLLDELPEVLHNLHKLNKNDEASEILKNLRIWRQTDQFSKLKFILSGSIGIHYVVEQIEGRLADINDLRTIEQPPFDKDEAKKFIEWATKDATIKYNEENTNYLVEKINYCVPYFLNLMLDEIDRKAKKRNESNITIYDIDNAFEEVVKNNTYFEDWKLRLTDYLPQQNFQFVNEILIHIAHKDFITIQEIYNKAIKHNKSEYMSFIKDLVKDGYIVEIEKNYVFISPFLKEFWKLNNPIYNE